MARANGTYIFDPGEFLASLIGELGPILTLFGEQPTRQFLSLSVDWGDYVLLASFPLGILTIIVTMIRIDGPPWLRAFVGRAREERSLVEREAQSSTSEDVCELWTRHGIARTKGQLPEGTMTTLFLLNNGKILTASSAALSEYYDGIDGTASGTRQGLTMDRIDEAPNLTLDLRDARDLVMEIRLFALSSVSFRFAVFPVAWLITYVLDLGPLSASQPPGYIFAFYVIGSSALFLAVVAAAYIIDSSTEEWMWKFRGDESENILVARLQRACTVGEQHFQPYAVFNPLENPDICISTPVAHPQGHGHLVVAASAVAVIGFILQFWALRSLHWLITCIELFFILVYTFVRAYVRRGLAPNPLQFRVIDTQELASFCLAIAHPDGRPSDDSTANPFGFIKHLGKQWRPESMCDGSLPRACCRPLKSPASALENTARCIDQSPINPDLSSIKLELRDAIQQPGTQPVWAVGGVKHFTSALSNDGAVIRGDVRRLATRLAVAMRAVVVYLGSAKGDEIRWNPQSVFTQQRANLFGPGSSSAAAKSLIWEVPIIRGYGVSSEISSAMVQRIRIDLNRLLPRDCPEDGQEEWLALYAVLSFWLHTLAFRYGQTLTHCTRRDFYHPQMFYRVVGRVPPEGSCDPSVLSEWLDRDVSTMKLNPGLSTSATPSSICNLEDEEPRPRKDQLGDLICFGMSLSYARRDERGEAAGSPDGENSQPPSLGSSSTCLVIQTETDIVTQCAHELFSMFILAVAAEIKEVRGETWYQDPFDSRQRNPSVRFVSERTRRWSSVLNVIAEAAVRARLADNLTEALALVVPAFAYYGLLDDDPLDSLGGSAGSDMEERWTEDGVYGEGSGGNVLRQQRSMDRFWLLDKFLRDREDRVGDWEMGEGMRRRRIWRTQSEADA